jgi:hypothetical protein
LSGTGLSLDSSGVIVGIPTQVTPLTTLAVTADVCGSPATASQNIKYSILADTFTFTDVCANILNFIENIPITPVRFPVTTLSERNVIGYSQTGLPDGIIIDPGGTITGTPTSSSPTAGNATITATTGYASGSRDFSYNITPDSILITFPQSTYLYEAGSSVSIQATGTYYSGATVSNYGVTLDPSYGLTIGSSSGLISGTWTNSIPPNKLLPASETFNVTGEVGDISGSADATFTASPIIQNTSFVWGSGRFFSSNPTSSWVVNSNVSNTPTGFDIVIKNSNVDGNFILATASDTIYRSTNANDFTGVLVGGIDNDFQLVSSLAFKPGTTTWWASGSRILGGSRRANIIQSDDNGVTWQSFAALKSASSLTEMVTRDHVFSLGTNPYLTSGIALKYQDGVMMAGGKYDGNFGPTMLRSTDDGVTWNEVIGGFRFGETAYYNLDVSGMWVATGSDDYSSEDDYVYSGAANTIKYSTDGGQSWSDATGGFNMFGYELVYGNNVWLASGVDWTSGSFPGQTFTFSMKYSTDGSNWSPVSGIPTIDFSFTSVSVAPIATYDFNNYSASSPTISNEISPSPFGSASINLPTSNVYVTADPTNKYLTMFAPNNFPSETGAITTPSISGVYSVEMWVRLDVNLSYEQYFIDFRTGLADGFIIGAGGGGAGNIGSDWVGQKIYYNGDEVRIDSATYNPVTWLYNNGWTQVVLVSSTPFTDDMTFFAALTNQQGMPISVAEISIYDVPLTPDNVRAAYVNKNLRYNLPFIVPRLHAPLPIGSMNYDGSNWNVFTQTQDPSANWVTKLYTTSDVSGSWTNVDVSLSQIRASSRRRLVTYTRPQFLRPTSSRTIDITLSFDTGTGVGPVVSPSSSSFLLYQYVQMSLQLSAVGTGTVYFFISAASLPPGLTFNPITNIISGKPAQIGTFTTTVYAKDDIGITAVEYTFTVNVPRIIRRQDGAGAYTSLLRQYTEVLSAQSGRDSRALPSQEARLGEFMSPVPVAVTTKTFNTNCANCLRQDCAAANAIVDANGAFTAVCDFIDGNSGEIFDAGNAEGNICD